MKVTVEKPSNDGSVSIADMKPGTIGESADGDIFFRTYDSAACLTNHGCSFTKNANNVDDTFVRVLPSGTVITLEIE